MHGPVVSRINELCDDFRIGGLKQDLKYIGALNISTTQQLVFIITELDIYWLDIIAF